MAEPTDTANVILTRPDDIEKSAPGIVKRWKAELALADQAEKDWRKEADDVFKLYDSKDSKANSFNILWSNTETLAPAVYNSTPEPDVRRRFRDADPIGKVASTALERGLSYQIDDYDFDSEIQDVVLDVLLPGRGLARIVYEPHFVQVGQDGVKPAPAAGTYQEPPEDAQDAVPDAGDAPQPAPPYEQIVGQDARCAHVQWDDFRHGPGKRWPDVNWISFRHEFTQEMCEEKFGEEIAKKLEYAQGKDSDKIEDKQTKEIFKVIEVQEIWDRDKRRVLFIAITYKDGPLLVVPDPLKLREFYPIPRPIYAIANSRSLVPTPLYRMYKEQAEELDRVSARINRIVNTLKVRGAYAGHIKEAGGILELGDNEMLAIENVSAIAEIGGLDKAIWVMPIDALAKALEYLYKARDQIKQAIYEISGIADILRGATSPSETLGAQQLKSQWGSLRIQKIQRRVQRFIRDLLRLKAEVIAEQFTAQQMASMTNIQLPDAQAKEQAQQAIQQAQMSQQPPPPQAQDILDKPTWDDVMAFLRSDSMRQYRVDIETDSTVADTINQDMAGFTQAVQGIGQIIAGSGQAVQSGMIPIDAIKEICLAFARKARTGSALEDALESIKAPAAPPPQAQAPPDHSLQIAQMQGEQKQAIAQLQEQNKQQIAQIQETSKAQREQFAEQLKSERVSRKDELDAAVRVIVASIAAQKTVDAATAQNAQNEFSQDVAA